MHQAGWLSPSPLLAGTALLLCVSTHHGGRGQRRPVTRLLYSVNSWMLPLRPGRCQLMAKGSPLRGPPPRVSAQATGPSMEAPPHGLASGPQRAPAHQRMPCGEWGMGGEHT